MSISSRLMILCDSDMFDGFKPLKEIQEIVVDLLACCFLKVD